MGRLIIKNLYTADFETVNNEEDCRIWAWGLYGIYTDNFKYGNDMSSFFDLIFSLPSKTKIYFHNLKFDGEFLFYWLFNNGFKHTTNKKRFDNEFSTLITFMGVFYAINITYEGREYFIYDSLKIIPLPVTGISKAYGLEQLKGEIDYNKERPNGYVLDNNEVQYLRNDVEIVGKALKTMFDEKLTKMTQASNAFSDFKKIMGSKRFTKLFPVLKFDNEIRQSYKGGWTYANPKFQNKIIKKGLVYDVNSLYPSVMYYEKLPYGEGIFYEGEYQEDKIYTLYIQMIRCNFELKEGFLPTIQLKNTLGFKPTEYVTDSNDLDVTMCLTSVDLELFLKHYNVYNLEFIGGWKFKASDKLFRDYIDKWGKIKEESGKNGNVGMKTLAKLMLNSLYGKFALNPQVTSKIPVFDGEFIHYKRGEDEERESIYVPVACFITANARKITIETAQKNYDRFLYADTDSVHLMGDEIPDIDIDDLKLGKWKCEGKFIRGKFLRAKSYVEEHFLTVDEYNALKEENKKKWKYDKLNDVYIQLHVCCAGLPHKSHEFITFDNFVDGLVVGGKLQHKRVKGGVVLKEIDFTIKI